MSDKKQAQEWVDKAQQALGKASDFLGDAEEAKVLTNLRALTQSVSKMMDRYAGEKEEEGEGPGSG